jgi:hypothetical protein
MPFEAVINNGLPAMPVPTKKMLKEWGKWVASRPDAVRVICEKFPPWSYYEMPKTKQIVVIEAWAEDGTMRVTVVGDQISIPAIVPFQVFGVPPDDLIQFEQ